MTFGRFGTFGMLGTFATLHRHRTIAHVFPVLVALCPAVAQARAPAPQAQPSIDRDARAAETKKRGDDLLENKRYSEALAAYDDAYALTPSPALLYNRGRALQFLARYPEALEAIERFAAEAPADLRARVPGLPQLLDDLRGRVGTLIVRCRVDGARVLVDDKQIAVTPVSKPMRVAAGHLAIDVFADGYFPLHREVDLKGQGALTLELALVSRDTSGLLTVRSHESATKITVDGKVLGLSPVEAGLVAGTHRVVAEKSGFDDGSTQVVVGAGDKKEVWLDPVARPALYAHWWFWTAVGVVIVGGVVTYVALTTERSAPSGNYSPGTVHF